MNIIIVAFIVHFWLVLINMFLFCRKYMYLLEQDKLRSIDGG